MANKALIKNGKIVVIDRAGVKTIPTVSGGIKSIDVVLTENAASIDIDLTSLNLKNGDRFDIILRSQWVDPLTGGDKDGRPMIRFNDISDSVYLWGTLSYTHFQMYNTIAYDRREKMFCQFADNTIYINTRANVRNISETMFQFVGYSGYIDNISSINKISLMSLNASLYIYKTGSKVIITKTT